MIQQIKANAENLKLDKFGSAEAVAKVRMQAMQQFLQDYEQGKQQGRYLDAELPVLPFTKQQFDLALCSHLLFLYSDQLALEFHILSIMEMCRVAKEVRIFPLLDLSHNTSIHLQPVVEKLKKQGLKVSIQTVNYEFQVGAHKMMKIENTDKV